MPRSSSSEKRQEWVEKIQQQQASGLSIKRWCNDNQIKFGTFYYWRDRIFPKTSLMRESFKELTHPKESGIFLEYRGVRIHIDKHFDAATLQNCLSSLMRVKC